MAAWINQRRVLSSKSFARRVGIRRTFIDAREGAAVMAVLVPRLSGSARPVVNLKSHTTPARRARACPGHPRRAEAANFESFLQRHGVDGGGKPRPEAARVYFQR